MSKIVKKIIAIVFAFLYFVLPMIGIIYYLVDWTIDGKETFDDLKSLWNSED